MTLLPFVATALITASVMFGQDVRVALQGGHFEQALQIVQPLAEADPGNPRLWTLKGMALNGLGRWSEGLASFERALTISPKMGAALEGAAEAAYRLHDTRTASYLTRILDLDQANQTAHAMAGVLAFESRKCVLAIAHFRAAGSVIETDPAALERYGVCLVQSHQTENAVEVFAKLVSRDSDNFENRYNLAVAQHEAGLRDKAIDTLQPFLKKEAGDPDALNLLGVLYGEIGKIQDAVTAFRLAAEKAPTDERNYLDLATLCMEHQAGKLGLDILSTGISNVPKSSKLHVAKGAILAQLGQTDEAEREFERANQLEPGQLYGSLGLGTLYQEMRRTGDALQLLRSRLKQSPDDYRLNFLLANTLLHGESADQESDAEAKRCLVRALKTKPDFAKAHSALGKLYRRTGEVSRAIDELTIAVALDPKDRVGLNQLQLALTQQNRKSEAEQIAAKLKAVIKTDFTEEIDRNKFKLR